MDLLVDRHKKLIVPIKQQKAIKKVLHRVRVTPGETSPLLPPKVAIGEWGVLNVSNHTQLMLILFMSDQQAEAFGEPTMVGKPTLHSEMTCH